MAIHNCTYVFHVTLHNCCRPQLRFSLTILNRACVTRVQLRLKLTAISVPMWLGYYYTEGKNMWKTKCTFSLIAVHISVYKTGHFLHSAWPEQEVFVYICLWPHVRWCAVCTPEPLGETDMKSLGAASQAHHMMPAHKKTLVTPKCGSWRLDSAAGRHPF